MQMAPNPHAIDTGLWKTLEDLEVREGSLITPSLTLYIPSFSQAFIDGSG